MVGEPERLASEMFEIVSRAGCEVSGVMHGLSLPPFTGLQIKYSTINSPQSAIRVIATALHQSGISYVEVPDPNQEQGSIYLYVGFKA